MSKTTAAQGKNQGEELSIPTLAQPAQALPPILQEGEDPDVLPASLVAPLGSAAPIETNAPPAADSLAALQQRLDASQARHRPAIIRREREQTADNHSISMEMPATGSMDAWERPDQMLEPVPDMMRFDSHAAELAFLEELVMIRIHETHEQGAEDPVPLGVNGRMIYVKRGQDVIVRRKYVEQLFNARTESVQTNIDRHSNGDPRNIINKRQSHRYPFSIMRDDSPRARAWEQKMREQRR